MILFLVSADFLATRYCRDIEIARAMERHEAGTARVIPIILRPVDWHTAPFGKLQALPRNGKPVTTWKNRDEAFADIARGIREAAGSLAAGAPDPPTPARPSPGVPAPPPKPTGAIDRATLVRTVSGLDPSDMAMFLTLIEGAAAHVGRHGTVPEQAAELIRWAESSTGPGLEAIRRALEDFRWPADGKAGSRGGPDSVLHAVPPEPRLRRPLRRPRPAPRRPPGARAGRHPARRAHRHGRHRQDPARRRIRLPPQGRLPRRHLLGQRRRTARPGTRPGRRPVAAQTLDQSPEHQLRPPSRSSTDAPTPCSSSTTSRTRPSSPARSGSKPALDSRLPHPLHHAPTASWADSNRSRSRSSPRSPPCNCSCAIDSRGPSATTPTIPNGPRRGHLSPARLAPSRPGARRCLPRRVARYLPGRLPPTAPGGRLSPHHGRGGRGTSPRPTSSRSMTAAVAATLKTQWDALKPADERGPAAVPRGGAVRRGRRHLRSPRSDCSRGLSAHRPGHPSPLNGP